MTNPNSGGSLPDDPVELPKGIPSINQNDFTLKTSYGPSISIDRSYNDNNKNQLSPFGYGWNFPYDHFIKMYVHYHISEFRPNGSIVKHSFHQNNSSLFVNSYDGDLKIYYPLDQGYFTSDTGDQLERISQDEYKVTRVSGITYFFKGYQKSWSESDDPARGSLAAIEDRNGNRLSFTYDNDGHLTKIIAADGRMVTFTYEGDLVSTLTDPLGRVTTYELNFRSLISVGKP